MSLNALIVKIGRTYLISAGSMGVISMLEPLAALELHAPVVAVPEGVARDVQGVVEVAAADVEVDVEVDSMFLCSIISLWRLFNNEFFPQSVAAALPPYSVMLFHLGSLISTSTGYVLGPTRR